MLTTKILIPDSTEFADRIPRSLLDSDDPFDARLYLKLVDLSKSSGRDEFQMPGMRQLAASMGVSWYKLNESMERLEQAGWIHRTNKDMTKSVRYRTIVKWVQLELEVKLNEDQKSAELYSEEKLLAIMRKALNISRGKTDTYGNDCLIIDNPAVTPIDFQFSPTLTKIINNFSRKDLQNKTLSDYTHYELQYASFGASERDIADAIIEMNQSPGAKPMKNVIAIFSSRFTRDGKLNPNRKCASRKVSYYREVDIKDYVPNDPPAEQYHIYPSTFFAPTYIDQLCERLNARESVEKGDIPVPVLTNHADIFIAYGPEEKYRVTLNEHVELVKIKSGYWRIEWVQLTPISTQRSSQQRRTVFRDGIEVYDPASRPISEQLRLLREQYNIHEEEL